MHAMTQKSRSEEPLVLKDRSLRNCRDALRKAGRKDARPVGCRLVQERRMGVIFRKASETRLEELDEALESVEADDERRSRGAGVGVRLRMESLRLREWLDGCACALVSGWKRVEVSKWTGILKVICVVVNVVLRRVDLLWASECWRS